LNVFAIIIAHYGKCLKDCYVLSARKIFSIACLVIVLGLGLFAWKKCSGGPDAILAHYVAGNQYPAIRMVYPFDKTLFPPEIIAPHFRWQDGNTNVNAWVVWVRTKLANDSFRYLLDKPEWTPEERDWEQIKTGTRQQSAQVLVLGFNRSRPREVLSKGELSLATSADEVGAPIFYREVNLPFIEAVKDPTKIRWCFGDISSPGHPKVVLDKIPVCGNCHSFSKDGRWFGMDVDYANNKGSYIITQTARQMPLASSNIITWDDYQKGTGARTYGFLSQISPDGSLALSTVKDKSVFVAKPDLAFSQLFFPLQGILVCYDRRTREFKALPGADDPAYVQSNPVWSPDGKTVLFARAKTYELKNTGGREKIVLSPEDCREFLEGGKTFQFDLYHVPFNGGKGGEPEPLEGASHNGKSNFFPRYSPDGKWIVFCQAGSFMLLQPDSELFIVPAKGGQARRLLCNTARMNSWHSWSPNGKWLVFSSKAFTPYTQLFLTHIDAEGNSSAPVLLEQFTLPDRAANIPEFVNLRSSDIEHIDENFLNDLSYARSAYAFDRAGDVDKAIRDYTKALEVNPVNPQVHMRLGYLLYHKKHKYDEGMKHTLEAVRLDPENGCARFDLGLALFQQQKMEEAVKQLKMAVNLPNATPALYPPEEMWELLGSACLFKGDAADAINYLAKAVEAAPKRAEFHYRLAIALANSGDIEKAMAQCRSSVELNPGVDTSSALHMQLSDNFSNVSQWPEAVAEARQALAIAKALGDQETVKDITARIEALVARERTGR
jgi:tetratricopeptide (TPR) repeat protein